MLREALRDKVGNVWELNGVRWQVKDIYLYKCPLKNAVFFILLPPLTMAEYSEKQQPPVYPTNPGQGYPVTGNQGPPVPNQGYPASQGYPAVNQAPNVVNVLPQPLAVTGQQYRDQCK